MGSRTTSWTVQDAKAQLSEILRKAQDEQPQFIGRHKKYVVLTEREFLTLKSKAHVRGAVTLGRRLMAISPQVDDFALPSKGVDRPNPFAGLDSD
jgi:prevent-host-death family protein